MALNALTLANSNATAGTSGSSAILGVSAGSVLSLTNNPENAFSLSDSVLQWTIRDGMSRLIHPVVQERAFNGVMLSTVLTIVVTGSANAIAYPPVTLATISGLTYLDITVASLTAEQAAGTSPVAPANFNRKAFGITPLSDGKLYIKSATGLGFYWAIYAGVTRTLTGQDCPFNELYVTGQTAGSRLVITESVS